MKPTIGRILHYVQAGRAPMTAGSAIPLIHLPAIVVAIHSEACVNLQILTDGSNSEPSYCPEKNVKWVTSVTQDETATKPNTWHWPERD